MTYDLNEVAKTQRKLEDLVDRFKTVARQVAREEIRAERLHQLQQQFGPTADVDPRVIGTPDFPRGGLGDVTGTSSSAQETSPASQSIPPKARLESSPEPSYGPKMRTFATGATRNLDDNRLDYEGFLSEAALTRYAEYMHKHRKQADGTVRDSDNWQKGIPRTAYVKSMFRHFIEVWRLHRQTPPGIRTVPMQEALCALLFNVLGYLHEEVKNG